MWDRVDRLLQHAPHEHALRLHRVELLEARRRRAAGAELGSLVGDEAGAALRELAALPLLARVRVTCDGPLVLHKGPEVALDYPAHARSFCDLGLLTDDAAGAQAALLAAARRGASTTSTTGREIYALWREPWLTHIDAPAVLSGVEPAAATNGMPLTALDPALRPLAASSHTSSRVGS